MTLISQPSGNKHSSSLSGSVVQRTEPKTPRMVSKHSANVATTPALHGNTRLKVQSGDGACNPSTQKVEEAGGLKAGG